MVFHLRCNAKSTWQRYCEHMSACTRQYLQEEEVFIMAGLGYIQYGQTTITWIGKYCLTGNGAQVMSLSRLGEFMSLPGIEQRMYQEW